MPTHLAHASIAATPTEWRDAIVRALALDAPAGRAPTAYLTEIGDGGAALLLPSARQTLILLLWPPVDQEKAVQMMRDRLERLLPSVSAGAHIVIVGGGAEALTLCRQAQPAWRLRQRTALHHLSEDGTLWNAGGGFKLLDATVAAIRSAIRQGRVLPPLAMEEAVHAREEFRRLATAEQSVATSLRRRRVPGTIGLLVAISAVFGLELLWGGPDTPGLLYRMGAVDRTALLHGEWWRLISPAFLHAGYTHILVNGWSLWVLGVLLERLFGTARFLVLYTVGTVTAALCSAAFNMGLSVGASGAIFALMGGLIGIAWRPNGLIPPTMAGRLRQSLWPPLVANVAISMVPRVDWHAHLGGGLGGLALVGSGLLVRGLPQPGQRDGRVVSSAGWLTAAVISVVVLTAGVAAALWHGRPWDQSVGQLTRVSLGNTHVSLELPERLRLATTDKEGPDHEEFVFGTLMESPIEVDAVVVTDPAYARASPQEQASFLQAQAARIHEKSLTREGDPTIQITPAGPVVHFSANGTDGLREETWLTVRGDHLIRLDFLSTAETSAAWQELSPTLVASVQADDTPR